ncbi:DUF2971 domain-containing protein [Pseudoteredinibacter isoporae]|uniref:DUF2971 domain-containing protein n=1 Tax=Pseudoteredinibacter isoporae TaxID=570281 RepID=UPI003340023D
MKIYKFRSLSPESNPEHVYQMISESSFWCASPESLNDTNEFRFKMNYVPTHNTGVLLMKSLESHGRSGRPPYVTASYAILNNSLDEVTEPIIRDVISQCRTNIGITSFSVSDSGEWLWRTYGGDGNGVVVEFEVPDDSIGHDFHFVNYVDDHEFHVDLFLSSNLDDRKSLFREMLCTKTKKWKQEQEVRFLGNAPNTSVKINNCVTGVVIGKNVSSSHRNNLVQLCESRGISVRYQNA